jgi:hypothetical protein
LQAYIHAAMPWYKPGGLTDERAWQVTTYVLKLNNIDAGPVLNAETAAKIRLAPEPAAAVLEAGPASSGAESAPAGVESPVSSTMPVLIAGALAVILLLVGGMFWRRRARR